MAPREHLWDRDRLVGLPRYALSERSAELREKVSLRQDVMSGSGEEGTASLAAPASTGLTGRPGAGWRPTR